jgi:hypothetical protein
VAMSPIGPQICENPNLQQAFNQFHHKCPPLVSYRVPAAVLLYTRSAPRTFPRLQMQLPHYCCHTLTQSTSVCSSSGVDAFVPEIQPPLHMLISTKSSWLNES